MVNNLPPLAGPVDASGEPGKNADEKQNNVAGNREVGHVASDQDGAGRRTDGTARSRSDQGHGSPVLYTDEDIDAGLGAIYSTTRLPNIQARELAQHVRLLIESSRSERLTLMLKLDEALFIIDASAPSPSAGAAQESTTEREP